MSTTPHPLSITDREAPFLPETIEAVAELAEQLEALGEFSPALINGCVAWAALKAAGRKDRTSDRTRAKYRKMLVRLAEVDPPPRRRSQAGVASLLAVAGVTATAAVGAATKDPRAAALAVPALVYITYRDGDGDSAGSPAGHLGQSLHTVSTLRADDLATPYTLPAAA